MAVNPTLLLYIEPSVESLSRLPLIDRYVRKMTASLRKSKRGVCKNYDHLENFGPFEEGDHWMGYHGTATEVTSDCQDRLLTNGEITNNLCVYYLAWHRSEISEDQLKRVDALTDGEEEPNMTELHITDLYQYRMRLFNDSTQNERVQRLGNGNWKCMKCGYEMYSLGEPPRCRCGEDRAEKRRRIAGWINKGCTSNKERGDRRPLTVWSELIDILES